MDAHAQAEHLLIRGGSSPPAECCWEVVAFSSCYSDTCRHQDMEQVFADASFRCTLVLAISHMEARRPSGFDQQVPGG